MYRYQVDIPDEEHDEFVRQSPLVNILQSSAWASIKSEWGNEKVGFYKDDKLVGVSSLLYRSLPFGFTMCYIARGPIIDYTNRALVEFVFTSLRDIVKRRRALFIKIDPTLCLSKTVLNKQDSDYSETLVTLQYLRELGFIWSGKTTGMADTIQPRIQAKIYKENFGEDKLSKSTKQAIRTAQNKGIKVQFGGIELLDSFSLLMKKTEARKNISLRNEAYYRNLLLTFQNHAYITLSTLDLSERLQELEEQWTQNQIFIQSLVNTAKSSKFQTRLKEKERLDEEITFLKKHISAGVLIAPLAGTLTLEFGQTSVNLYAGMDEEFKRYNAPILTWYQTAHHAFERGSLWQNLGGIEHARDGGLYRFKSNFNPTIEEYFGEFTLPTHPLYPVISLVFDLRKKLRKKYHRK
jgi:beta-lactam resistance factor